MQKGPNTPFLQVSSSSTYPALRVAHVFWIVLRIPHGAIRGRSYLVGICNLITETIMVPCESYRLLSSMCSSTIPDFRFVSTYTLVILHYALIIAQGLMSSSPSS
jgi:hypothetical protein